MSDDVVPVLDPLPLPVEPGPVRRGWLYSGLVALAILVSTLGLSIPGFAVTVAFGYAMVFAGPVYAAFYVPIAVRKWLREDDRHDDGHDDEHNERGHDTAVSAMRDLTVGFGTLNQKLTMILSVVLVVNLIVFVSHYLADATQLVFACGVIAVAVGMPVFLLNLIWIGRPHAVPGENLAVRNRVGAWRLISANRVLSLLIWCGYPLVSIIGIVVYL